MYSLEILEQFKHYQRRMKLNYWKHVLEISLEIFMNCSDMLAIH